MKKIALCMTAFLLFTQIVYAAPQNNESAEPSVKAQGAVLMELETGRVLWGKNEDAPMPMASTTKIMTAILAIESGKLEQTVIASQAAASAPKVRMNLQKGEEHRLGDLLYPLMLQSSNDAAVAIAEHVGGSVEGFCQMMNQKAAELGCTDTVFETPNGLDKGDHHSTARDMALITRYALNNEEFVKIINTTQILIPTKEGSDEKSYYIANTNRLLNEYEGALGVKSGFTGKAGQCFVGAAKKGDMTLISVVLASGWGTAGKEQKWRDTKALLNYGFENFERISVIQKGQQLQELPINHSRKQSIGLVFGEDISVIVSNKEKENLKIEFSLPQSLEAPVQMGQRVGSAKIFVNEDEVLGSCTILAGEEASRHDFQTSLKKIINSWLNIGKQGIL